MCHLQKTKSYSSKSEVYNPIFKTVPFKKTEELIDELGVCKHAINTILWSAEKLCALLCRIYKTVFPAPRPFPDLIYDNLDKRAEQLLSGYHQSFFRPGSL